MGEFGTGLIEFNYLIERDACIGEIIDGVHCVEWFSFLSQIMDQWDN